MAQNLQGLRIIKVTTTLDAGAGRAVVHHARALRIDHKGQVHERHRLQLAQQQQQLASGFFSSQIKRHESVNRRMSWGLDVDAHYRVIRELRQESLAKIARNAGDNDGWLYRIHLVGVFGRLVRRLCSHGARRHGRSRGAGTEIGFVQVDIALKSLHAVAITLA